MSQPDGKMSTDVEVRKYLEAEGIMSSSVERARRSLGKDRWERVVRKMEEQNLARERGVLDVATYHDFLSATIVGIPLHDIHLGRFEHAVAHLLIELVSAGDLSKGRRVLDLGCGTGVITVFASQRVGDSGSVTGVDISPGMIEAAHGRAVKYGVSGRVRLHASNLFDFQEPGEYDTVLCINTVFDLAAQAGPGHSVEELARTAEVLYKHAKKGGQVVLTVPFHTLDYPYQGIDMLRESMKLVGGWAELAKWLPRQGIDAEYRFALIRGIKRVA